MTRCWNNDHHQLRPRQGLLDIHRYGMNLGVTIFPDTGEFDGFSGQSMGKILGKIWVLVERHRVAAQTQIRCHTVAAVTSADNGYGHCGHRTLLEVAWGYL